MQVEVTTVQRVRLSKLDKLDPITITLEDDGPGKGGITIACYGKSWTSYWGAMSGRRIAAFFRSCSGDYLAEKLSSIPSRIVDYDAISDRLGYPCDVTTLELSDDDMTNAYGAEWRERLPTCANPEYVYLLRIIKAAQDGIAHAFSETA